MPPPRKTVERARSLRRATTTPEVVLWQYLRSRPAGLRFRRQHPVGRFVLDFYCPSAKLAVEIDGMAHDMGDNPDRDTTRDAWLLANGIETLRIAASDVMTHFEAVTEYILMRCARPLRHPADGPLPHDIHGED